MNYDVRLGVSSDADSDTIRSAFRALVRRYRPDAGEGSSAQRFREIVEAYETLTDRSAKVAAIILFVGYASIPASVLAGLVK